MRYIVLCLVLGSCAAGFHANPTDQGVKFEMGFYPTEASGDFNATNEDAGTRRVYANACDRAREPAACLFALSAGANVNAARLAYSCGSRYCWGGGGGSPRPFGGSARGMVPMGASYDVAAVSAEYSSVAASFGVGPDIVRLRPAYLEREPVEEPPALSRGGAAASGGGGVARSGDAGASAPRHTSLPRPPGASAPSVVGPQYGRCEAYPEIARQYGLEFAALRSALVNAQEAAARQHYQSADRILLEGLTACEHDPAARSAIQRVRVQLNELAKRVGITREA